MKKVLIIEDQKDTREALKKIVLDVKEDAKVFDLADKMPAYEIIAEHTIDLFLIDIILKPEKASGDTSGLTFIEYVRKIPKYRFTPVIFVTALYDAKLYSYSKLHCYQFVEKPFDVNEVHKLIEEVIDFSTQKDDRKTLFYRVNGVIEAINVSEIIYFESRNHVMKIKMTERIIKIPKKTCKEVLADIDSDDFIQCNRNTIINRHFIQTIDTVNRYIKLKKCDEVIDIGMIMKKQFLKALQESFGTTAIQPSRNTK